MKYLDFSVQTLMLGCALMIVLLKYPSQTMYMDTILTCQFYTGLWQIASAIISVVLRTPLHDLKNNYLLMVVGYFMMMGLLSKILPVEYFGMVGGIIIPWVYAIGYYAISLRALRSTSISGKGFLPHTSF